MPLKTSVLKALKSADVFEVTEIDLLAKTQQLRIYWSAGVNEVVGQDEEGNDVVQYRQLDTGNHTVGAESLGKLKPDGTKTWYANIKALAYNLLIQAGIFPNDGVLE